MKLDQSFEVNAPLERVWKALIDIERVAPCLPGASVTGRNDDGSYNGSFSVRIGPTSASYTGKLEMRELDEGAHRATMHAQGTDKRGQGGAEATIVSTLHDLGEGRTRVEVSTDYRITGRLARFGRGGMIEDIAGKLLGQFAQSLQGMVGAEGSAGAAAGPSGEVAAPSGEAAARGEEPAPPAEEAAAAPPPHGGAAPAAAAAAPPPPHHPPPEPAPPAAPAAELDAGALIGSVVRDRLKRNPAALAALACAALAPALLLVRRRARRRAARRARR
jgi:carbon monoxide dehydrogenase subunit G